MSSTSSDLSLCWLTFPLRHSVHANSGGFRACYDPVLAGSSYGGLTASIVAMRMPDAFRGLLLCAPALHLDEPPVNEDTILVAPKGMKTIIIHGVGDDIVPISCSVAYAERSGNDVVAFHQVNDGHRLADSHKQIIDAAQLLIGETIDS